MTDVQVFARNSSRQLLPELTQWSQLTCHFKRIDVSRWTLVTQDLAEAAFLMPVSNSQGRITAPKGVIIRRGDLVLLSGWVKGWPKRDTVEGVTTWEFSGWDDTVHLGDALVWPSPSNPITSQAAYRVFAAGTARSNIIRTLFIENVGTRLAIPGAVGGSALGLGGTLPKQQFRFPSLLETAQTVAGRSLNFQVRQRDTDAALFLYTWLPVDKRDSVVFSPDVATANTWGHSSSSETASRVVIAAGGELEARGLRLYADSVTEGELGGLRKIERFKDRRDLDITNPEPGDDWVAEAAADAAEFLEEARARSTFTLAAKDRPGLRYGDPFLCGDLVRAYTGTDSNGQPLGLIDDLIEEAVLEIDPDEGESCTVRVGSIGVETSATAALQLQIRRMQRRLAALETRY